MKLSDAFRRYHATPTNIRWSVTAISATEPPELVCALVGTYREWMRRREDVPANVREYRDDLRDWGKTTAVNEARAHLQRAFDRGLAVRPIIVTVSSASAAKIDAEPGASMAGTAQDFEPRPQMVGRVTAFDGNAFVIRFERAPDAFRTASDG